MVPSAASALARKRRGSSGIVSVMIGDGTLGEGLLYESMNPAAVWDALVLFIHIYFETTPIHSFGSLRCQGHGVRHY